ncbi:MAG: uncharacterized protein K0R63_64 [Rickettsiales bacterium]|jgi:hypothetical protein|nr:uncharacterized protein [Rickettsiales bacterium]
MRALEMVSFLQKKKDDGNDLLGREIVAEKLTTIISSITQPFVIGIEGSFGSGKTFFLNQLQEKLQEKSEKKANVIHFNAWETDHANDPLMAFLLALEDSILGGEEEARKSAREAGKGLLIGVAANVVGSLLSTATFGVVNSETVKDFLAVAETVRDERYEAYKLLQSRIKEFKVRVGELGEKLKEESGYPVIIIIDELDRCRPTYAIELLEVIKHFFDIENYVFVLGMDKDQMVSSIRAVYGQGTDGDNYLRKFVDWEFKLPSPAISEVGKFVDNLYKGRSLNDILQDNRYISRGGAVLRTAMIQFSKLFNLSLREIDQYMTHLNLIVRLKNGENFFPELLVLLLILRDKKKDLYLEYGTKLSQGEKIVQYLEGLESFDIVFNSENTRNDFLASVIFGGELDLSRIDGELFQLNNKLNNQQPLTEQEQKNKKIFEKTLRLTNDLNISKAQYLYRNIEFIVGNTVY